MAKSPKIKLPSPKQFRQFISKLDDENTFRFHYCYQLGSTFVLLNKMEDAIIHSMSMCDRVKVKTVLGADATAWERSFAKHTVLQNSTLGTLIAILSRHAILDSDLRYLRWLKEKRDIFVHRFFREGAWPGDLDAEECGVMVRRLRYLEIIYDRASAQVWKILARAKLIELEIFADGMLAINSGMFDTFEDGPVLDEE
jgi:hypothetical protein